MNQQRMFSATYRDGAFHPDEPCDLPEGFKTTITLTTVPPILTDPEERKQSVQRLLERLDRTPIVGDPPKFTREDLHDRY